MKKYIIFLFLFLISEYSNAVPSGDELLKACEKSLKNGFQSAAGMMCVWYVTPCDCHDGKDSDILRVCLPEEIEEEFLARMVIEGLKANPYLKSKTAEIAASEILAPKYPCD